jgi:hypothetical protein
MSFKSLILWVVLFFGLFAYSGAQPCDKKYNPLVLVHGFLGAGDNYAHMLHTLYQAGYCPKNCFVYDWNTMERVNQTPQLERFIDSIIKITGSKQVDLVGHSAGGGVGYAFLDDSLRMQKVAHYVHIGSTMLKTPAGKDGSIPTLNLYSADDKVVKGGDIPGATNIKFTRFDHFELVTADSIAACLFEFLHPGIKFSKVTPIQNKGNFSARGRVITLGQNQPQAGAKISVQKVNGMGAPGSIFYETITDKSGGYQLKGLEEDVSYLIQCSPINGRKISYFFPKIKPNENLLYLRTLPKEGMVAAMLGSLPQDSMQTGAIIFSNTKAIISGRDELVVNGLTLSTPAFADASKTAVAWFLLDGNKNGQTDSTLIQPLSNFPFLRAVDICITPASKVFTIQLNGTSYQVPALPSSESLILLVL